jgi:NtrC-family two-component system response regulator AlgB
LRYISNVTTSPKARVLVVDDDDAIRRTLRLCLESAGYSVAIADGVESAAKSARRAPPDLALVDLRLGSGSGVDLTRTLLAETPATRVVIMTAYATIDSAVEAMRAGAVDYLPKPFHPAQVLHTVEKVLSSAVLEGALAEALRDDPRRRSSRFETKSAAVQSALDIAERVAPTDATVLLLGETGTGKGVLARHIHSLSPRRSRPFVTFNCAAASVSLIETELFGHAKGAFTGADAARAGHIEAASTGTLFLDEIGDLPREVQGKLLRLLEEHEYVRVGDTEPRRSEARVLAATHRDLRADVAKGVFRDDLFFRLNVVSLKLPALRERREDLDALCRGILSDLAAQHRRPTLIVTPAAARALAAYAWPGNLRELVNVLERAVILARGEELTPDLLPEELGVGAPPGAPVDPADETLEAAERRHIAAALAKHPTLDAAAKALGIDPSTLYRKRDRYGLR